MEKRHNKAISKAVSIISKLISDQYLPVIKEKIPKKAWIALQKRIQYINLMSTSYIIYNATIKKLSDFKSVHKYTSHYQALFNKVSNLLIETSTYIRKNTEM